MEEYLVDLNATRAARAAGYSAKNADKIGSRLVGKSRVQTAIQAGRAQLATRTGWTRERIVAQLEPIAEFAPGARVPGPVRPRGEA